jgi:1,2-diacylglycerol 3-beta-glucosyltransferase
VPAVILPFEGLSPGWQTLFFVCLAVVIGMFVWSAVLFVRALSAARLAPPAPIDGAEEFTWVFLVPALNEEVTIRDSVERLLGLGLSRRRVIVIDDASDDRTAEVLASMAHPDLTVLARTMPEARQGKAAALNFAYRSLRDLGDRERTVIAIVDADGRLDTEAPRFAASQFAADPAVGGVQSLVRIYNRRRLLTWLQDLEFSVYGYLFQAGRDDWGTAGMGGNGQFNRLSALDDIAAGAGPWRDRLTEDQDLGLRLIARGWKGRQELRATVDQQGLSRPRRLLNQRTRWSQGNLQAMDLRGEVRRAPFPRGARFELLLYLLMPFWQGIIGVGLVAALFLAASGEAPFWGAGPTWQLGFFYVLAFGGTILGCVAARASRGPLGWLQGLLVAQVYAPYTWFLWPVLIRSSWRQLRARDDWSKTEREPLDAGEEPARGPAIVT